MCSDPRESYEEKAAHYLDSVENVYVLNESSGLYEPEPKHGEEKSKAKTAESNSKSPIFVNILRDWVAITISTLTLLLLGATIFYARRQWIEMNSTFVEMQKQTGFAQTSAADATQNMKNTEEFFRMDERAWVEIEPVKPTILISPVPIFGTIYSYNLFPKNVGKTLARDVVMRINQGTNGPWIVSQSEILIRLEQDKLLMGKLRDQLGKIVPVENDRPIPRVLAPGISSPTPYVATGPAPVHSDKTINYGFLIGRIDYVDAFNIPHWMKFCFVILNLKGDLANCKYGNDEDRNPETPTEKKK
jgi:hypothetical protein